MSKPNELLAPHEVVMIATALRSRATALKSVADRSPSGRQLMLQYEQLAAKISGGLDIVVRNNFSKEI